MFKKRFYTYFICIFLSLISCSSLTRGKVITIGIDPSFELAPVGNRNGPVHAFCVELIEKAFKQTPYSVNYVTLSFTNKERSLHNGECDIIVSSITPNFDTNTMYSFSSTFLPLGDVFVSRVNERMNIKDYAGKIIAVPNNPKIISLFANYPMINLTFYQTNTVHVLESIANYTVDGAIVPLLYLSSHFSKEYMRLLQVHPRIMTNTALRLISKKNTHIRALKTFNEQVALMKQSGNLKRLYKKWQLF